MTTEETFVEQPVATGEAVEMLIAFSIWIELLVCRLTETCLLC